ncbi:MAG: DUF2764 family protein [Bacteroidota bacterium]
MIQNNYYYVVSGLPDILPEDTKAPLTVDELREQISHQLDGEDYKLFSILFLPRDHENLLRLLNKEDSSDAALGNFSIGFLEEQIRGPQELPAYLQYFIENYQNNKEIYPELSWKDQLTRLYYEYVDEVVDNDFLLQWIHFENLVSNIEIAYAARRHNIELSGTVIGDKEIIDVLNKSNIKAASEIKEIPYIDKIIRLCEADNLKEREIGIDRVKWDYLDDITAFHYFTIEKILAYTLKLMMLNRWVELSPERGKEKIEKLIEDLQSGYDIPAEYVV